MVLAAGLGTRMRPLSDTMPKPLIKVSGVSLLDRVLDQFGRAGSRRAVVNTHYLAEQIEAHLAARQGRPVVSLSPETDLRLETGGGIARALPLLGPLFFSTNADSFWVGDETVLGAMHASFDPARMDMLLLLAQREKSVGLEGHAGDFTMDANGRLARRRKDGNGEGRSLLNFTGTSLMHEGIFTDLPDGPFSLNLLFDRAIAQGRLFGHVLDGTWLTVGTPQELAQAELALAQARLAERT
jgi:N-acetyl-alpha-D-muramate 1-phosphate uridylyltransferase